MIDAHACYSRRGSVPVRTIAYSLLALSACAPELIVLWLTVPQLFTGTSKGEAF